jgi:transposase
MFQYRGVLVRMRQGDTDREIARAGLMGRPKAARLRALAADQGWLEPEAPLPDDATIAAIVGAARRARSTISTVEPHRTQVERWVAGGVSGVAIHAALVREHGYRGSYSAVRRIVAAIDAARTPDATVPLVFTPGEAAQVDFGAGPFLLDPAVGETRRTWCFVMTLAWSRHQYVEFVWDQSVATWLGCHRRAFEWFGAVPARFIIDNPKCAITKACMHDPLVQRAYAECAEGYGFRIDPCPPADPQKKGIVEAGVKYVKGNFLPLREFRDLADLNAQACRWVMEEAGVRIHGTTRERPLERFAVETPLMRALPAIAPDLGTWHRVVVHRDCHVQFDRRLYSVPFALVGKRLWLRATDSFVAIYEDYRLVANHLRARKLGERLTVTAHLPPEAQAFFARDRRWCVARAAEIGPATAELVERLLSDRIVERLRAAQGVLRLAETYSPARLESACVRALYHASPFFRTVKTILKGGYDAQPLPIAGSTESAYATGARFARDADQLFNPEHH